ncbi:MAG: substrate-binding domain-containing protein [Pseudomonadota bacterium]
MKKSILFAALVLVLLTFTQPCTAQDDRIVCASTTSTQNSGLFDYILPRFLQKTGIRVDVIAVGTGQAMAIAKRGDADVLLVHDPESEAAFVAEGYGTDRQKVMYNDFVVVGPSGDPARVKNLKTAQAYKRIAENNAVFVSRGDDSGTHKMEMRIWKAAGLNPKGAGWYMETGQGMESTIRIANEKKAYTLSDRATWLSLKDRQPLGLTLCVEGDPALFNQYSAMAVNPAKHPHVKYKEALRFINWLVSPEGQQIIGSFKDKNGRQLFIPNAGR